MPNRAAVVIGINYDTLPPGVHPDATKSAGINRLRYAEADARDVAALLTDAGYDVKLLTGTAATQRAIISAIVQQRRAAGPEGFLLIHYSGHGDVDPDNPNIAYLLPADTDPDALAASGIALNFLVQLYLDGVKSAVALLDCCHSGYALGWKSGGSERGRAFVAHARATFNEAHGRVVLAACAGAASTREFADLEHGAFTYYILDHWRSCTDEISIGSLFDNIDKGLQDLRLPRPVHGGTHEGRMVLRPPISEPAPKYRGPSLPPADAERREKLFKVINDLNNTGWKTVLRKVGVDVRRLKGTSRQEKTRSLIRELGGEGLLGNLEQAAREQAAREQAVREQAVREQALYYSFRGLDYQDRGDYDRAIAYYNRALELAPQQAADYWQRGVSYHAKGDYDRAIADYNRAIELDSQEGWYYYNRGLTYKLKGNCEAARRDFQRAVELGYTQAQQELANL